MTDVKDVAAENANSASMDPSATGNNESLAEDQLDELDFSEAAETDNGQSDDGQADKANEGDAAKEQEEGDQEGNPVKSAAEQRKEQLNREIRDLVAERNRLRQEIAGEQPTGPELPTVDGLMNEMNPETGEYNTRTEAQIARLQAEMEAERQQRQVDAYANQVADNMIQMATEASNVTRDFPVFDPKSGQYDPELTKAADDIFEQLLIKDASGRAIGSRIPPYQFYSAFAMAASRSEARGQVSGRKAAEQMLQRTDVVGADAASGNEQESDPFAEALVSDL